MKSATTWRTVAVGVSLLLLTACGSLPPELDFLAGTPKFVKQGPRSMAKAAFADMQDVRSIRVLGTQEDKQYGFVRLDFRLDDTSCAGSMDTPDGTMRVRKNDDGAWLSADEDFWRARTGKSPQADRMVLNYAGRWSAIDAKDKMLGMCDLDELLNAFTLDKVDTDDPIEAGEVIQLGDVDVVPLTGQDGRKRITAWVAVEAPHRVLKVAPANDTGRPDVLFFEEFGAAVSVESPTKKEIVVLPTR